MVLQALHRRILAFGISLLVKHTWAIGLPFNVSSIQPCEVYHYDWTGALPEQGPFVLSISPVGTNSIHETMNISIAGTDVYEYDFPVFYPAGTKLNISVVNSNTQEVARSDQATVQIGNKVSCVFNATTTRANSTNQNLTVPDIVGTPGSCDVPQFTWSGGVIPYKVQLFTTNWEGTFTRTFSNLTGSALSTTVQLFPNSQFKVSVQDAVGMKTESGVFNVPPLSDTSCLVSSWNVTIDPTTIDQPGTTASSSNARAVAGALIGILVGVVCATACCGFAFRFFCCTGGGFRRRRRTSINFGNGRSSDDGFDSLAEQHELGTVNSRSRLGGGLSTQYD